LTPEVIFFDLVLENLILRMRSESDGFAGKDGEWLEVSGVGCQVSGKRKIEAEH